MPRVSKYFKDIGRIRGFMKKGYSFPQIAIALGYDDSEGDAIRQFIWYRNKKERNSMKVAEWPSIKGAAKPDIPGELPPLVQSDPKHQPTFIDEDSVQI